MRTEERLRKSYEKQVSLFEEAKAIKLKHLDERKEQLTAKIQKLTGQLNDTEQRIIEIHQSSFRNFEEFKNQSRAQSESQRAKSSTEDANSSVGAL